MSEARPPTGGERDTGSDDASVRSNLWGSVTRTARITRWEITRSAGTVDRKLLAIVVAMLLVVGVVGLSVVDDGDAGLEDEIYVVGVDEESPYADVAIASEQFRFVPLKGVETDGEGDRANVDVVVEDGHSETGDSSQLTLTAYGDTGDPAADAFRDAIEDYNELLMSQEDDLAAAYPVEVTIAYQDRSVDGAAISSGTGTADDGDGTADDTTDDDAQPAADGTTAGDDDTTTADTTPDDTTTDGDETGPTDDDGGDDDRVDDDRTDDDGVVDDSTDDDGLEVPGLERTGANETAAETPGSISPPFPFESLILAFLFVVPMNFVIQAYGSTIMDERVKRRGELLLVSPASRYEIVAGKTVPYLLGLLAIVTAIALAVGGGVLSVVATVPIALLFLSATFVGAMLARSFKELTFVTVTISVFLTTYTFVPAIFTDVTPIALISPLTLVVMDLQGESVRLGEYLFSTGPFYCSGAVLFLLGIGIYREEDMFDQKPLPAKALDAIASRIHGYRSVPLLSILFIPFVFALQLLAVSLFFALPESVALPAIIVIAAAIEEVAKSVHVYAGFVRSRFEATLGTAASVGALSGAGFFVGEKFTHAAQFVGLPDLTVGLAAFGPALSANPLVVLGLFLAPLVLHVVTAIISAIGASRGRWAYVVGVVVATIVHAVYNLGVITLAA